MSTIDAIITVPIYLGFCLLLFILFLLGYRVTLHPLSRYPGPLVGKFTDCYSLYHAILKKLHLATWQNHLQHGSVVRLGPNKLVFNSVTALKEIYNNERLSKSRAYLVTMQAPGVHNIFDATDKQLHRTKRKLIGQVLTPRSMRDFEHIIIQQTNVFLKKIYELSKVHTTSTINISPPCKYLGLDIVSLLAFGQTLDTQTSSKNRFIANGITAGNFFQNMRLQYPRLAQLRFSELLNLFANIRERRAKNRELVEKLISDRLAEGIDAKHDLYSIVAGNIDTKGNGNIRHSEFWAEALFFLPAGGDTTSTCLAAVFFYLSRNETCYKSLCSEIRSTFTSGSEIRDGQQLRSCLYLRACIDEALRMAPPVPGALWREQAPTDTAGDEIVIDGHVIPRGTQVGVSLYSLHHNSEYFPDPFSYKPERWLSHTSGGDRSITHEACSPFSLGPRGCAGKAMAYMEVSLLISRTLWYFDFETAQGVEGQLGAEKDRDRTGRDRTAEFQIYDIFGTTHDGPNLVFCARDETVQELLEDTAD